MSSTIHSRRRTPAAGEGDQTTTLAAAQKTLDRAKDSYNGAQMLYDQGQADFAALLAAKQAVEDAQTAYDTAVETTNRAIETAQEAQELNKYKDTDTTSKDTLSNLKEQLADCEITAPCGGVVTAVNSKVGDINAEKNVIMTIEDTSSLKMVATVQEADVLKLQEGMEATVTADATGDEQIKGTRDQSGPCEESGHDGKRRQHDFCRWLFH